MNVLKLERYPLRILLPEREIRRRGVGRGGDIATPLPRARVIAGTR